MPDSDRHKKLYDVSGAGDVTSVRELLGAGALPHRYKDGGGYSALHNAASGGHRDVVLCLLDAGGDLNIQDNDGWTALHLAAWQGYKETARCLLERGADPYIPDKDGETSIQLAQNWPEIDRSE